MTHEDHQRELIERAGILLADRFREDFTPRETLAVLAATLARICAWLEHDDAVLAIAGFRQCLDDLERQRSSLH